MELKKVREHPSISKAELIPEGLAPGSEIVAEGKQIAKHIIIGKTLFMQEQDVSSEAEYKRRMATDGKIMFHAAFGLGSWQECIEGMKNIYEALTKRGAHLDRWAIIFARPMGLPPEMRAEVPKETGLMLASPEEWLQLGQVVPIQPYLGDHVIGSPASVDNLLAALAAGVTTIGNLGHYFGYDYPGWTDQTARAIATVKALGIMAQLKDKGVVVTSNLDDGPTSLLSDRADYIGWAMLEKYIVEDLIGAQLAHHFGNLVTEPQMRLALLLAIDEIHGREKAGGHINGNTVYSQCAERNLSISSSCLLFDIIGQQKRPTGHAVHAVPLTEYDRIPSPAENVQAVVLANQMEEEARKVVNIIDFSGVERAKDRIVRGGQLFRDRAIKGLAEIGIDITDPIEMLLALRRIGTRRMEELFGAGEEDEAIPGGRRPTIPTEMYQHTLDLVNKVKEDIKGKNLPQKMKGRKILLLATDVHEYAKFVIGAALKEAGVEVIDIGHSIDTTQVIKALLQIKVDGVCISTHNGMALTYAKDILDELGRNNLQVPIFMGGKLNELTGGILPRDVTADLRELTIIPCNDVFDILENLH